MDSLSSARLFMSSSGLVSRSSSVVELDYDVLHLVAPLKPTPAVILQT